MEKERRYLISNGWIHAMTSLRERWDHVNDWKWPLPLPPAVFFLILCAVEVILFVQSAGWKNPINCVLSAVFAVLTLMMIVWPVTSIVLFLTLWLLSLMIPGVHPAYFDPDIFDFTVAFCASLLLGSLPLRRFFTAMTLPCVAFLILLVFSLTKPIYFHTQFYSSLIEMVLVVAVIGISVRSLARSYELKQRETELKATRTEANQLRENAHLARQLHDGLTNDLTFIMTLAYLNSDSGNASVHKSEADDQKSRKTTTSHDASDATQWNLVYSRAQDALDRAHEAIDALRNPPPSSLQEHALKREKELEELGFHGTCRLSLSNIPERVPEKIVTEALGLVDEVFANIRRHGDPQGDWLLEVNSVPIKQDQSEKEKTPLTGQTLSVVEMNTVGRGVTDQEIGRSGRGLALHREVVKRLGGTMETQRDGGLWILRVSLPLDG
jgi:signal transduction histidine kinase